MKHIICIILILVVIYLMYPSSNSEYLTDSSVSVAPAVIPGVNVVPISQSIPISVGPAVIPGINVPIAQSVPILSSIPISASPAVIRNVPVIPGVNVVPMSVSIAQIIANAIAPSVVRMPMPISAGPSTVPVSVVSNSPSVTVANILSNIVPATMLPTVLPVANAITASVTSQVNAGINNVRAQANAINKLKNTSCSSLDNKCQNTLFNNAYSFGNNYDGSLVLNKLGPAIVGKKRVKTPIWSTNSQGKAKPPYYYKVLKNGSLAVYGKDGKLAWSSANVFLKGVGPYRLDLNDNGNVVLTDSNKKLIWGTGTAGL